MKTSTTIVFCVFFVIALLAVSCGATQSTETEAVAPENPLVGVWKITEVAFADPDTPGFSFPQPGCFIITQSHMASIGILGEEPRAEFPENPTDAQKAAEYDRLVANVAVYKLEGNTLTQQSYLVSQDPNVKPGDFWSAEYRFEGGDLFLTAKDNQNGPIENPYTLKCIRVE